MKELHNNNNITIRLIDINSTYTILIKNQLQIKTYSQLKIQNKICKTLLISFKNINNIIGANNAEIVLLKI